MMPAYIWDCGVPIAGLRLYDMCHSFVIPCGASDDEDDKSYNDEDTDGCVLHCSAFLIHGSVLAPLEPRLAADQYLTIIIIGLYIRAGMVIW